MIGLAKILMITGLIFVILGGCLYFGDRVFGLGKLPGDLLIKKENVTFYFPITTCVIISIVISIILHLWSKK